MGYFTYWSRNSWHLKVMYDYNPAVLLVFTLPKCSKPRRSSILTTLRHISFDEHRHSGIRKCPSTRIKPMRIGMSHSQTVSRRRLSIVNHAPRLPRRHEPLSCSKRMYSNLVMSHRLHSSTTSQLPNRRQPAVLSSRPWVYRLPNCWGGRNWPAHRLARCITIVQIIWFSINSIRRAVQQLQLTTLELTTLTYTPYMILISICWYHKPSSNERKPILMCKLPLLDILKAAGNEAYEPYQKTPLNIVSREEWTISLLWAHDLNILRKLHIPFLPDTTKLSRPFSSLSRLRSKTS